MLTGYWSAERSVAQGGDCQLWRRIKEVAMRTSEYKVPICDETIWDSRSGQEVISFCAIDPFLVCEAYGS